VYGYRLDQRVGRGMGNIRRDQGQRRETGSPDPGFPPWRRPAPLGNGPAVDAIGNVAAPLLAGFSVSTIGIVLTAESAIRWPGAVFITLTLAAASFIMCVQCNFHARVYFYSPADAADWWSESDFNERREDIQAARGGGKQMGRRRHRRNRDTHRTPLGNHSHDAPVP
jgi:hypothetical protein